MESKEKVEAIREVCQNCAKYGRRTKKCSVTGRYVPRKGSCPDFREIEGKEPA